MAFRLAPDETVQEGVRRIAREQVDKALDEIDDDSVADHEAVHQVRKRCKKLRGLIRLVRPQLEDTYMRENAWYRDAAQRLSYIRDAQSFVECFDDLVEHFEAAVDRDAFEPIRAGLVERREQVARNRADIQQRLERFRARMVEARERIDAWQLGDEGFAAVRGGLLKTYARGRAAFERAYKAPDTERFHEWRKRVKYHWYHLRLLRPVWDEPLKAARDEAGRLADLLGEDHDLSNLRDELLVQPDAYGPSDLVQALVGLIGRRQVELRLRAEPAGARLYAEKPARFGKRMRGYWTAWQHEIELAPQTSLAPELSTP